MEQPIEKRYTYADYLTWNDGKRYELIDGAVYLMSPAPTIGHQRLVRELLLQFGNYLRGKTCEVFDAPFDVRLNPDTEDDTVVQPDLAVVCDPSKLQDGKSCKGAPDLVIEILSPSTAKRDQFIKLPKYQAAGVREYWVVYPQERFVQVHLLREDGAYTVSVHGDADTVPVRVLEDCQIDLAAVFGPAPAEAPPKEP